jgi:hypothetical protein
VFRLLLPRLLQVLSDHRAIRWQGFAPFGFEPPSEAEPTRAGVQRKTSATRTATADALPKKLYLMIKAVGVPPALAASRSNRGSVAVLLNVELFCLSRCGGRTRLGSS